MVHEIWSSTTRPFCHFGPFFAFLPKMDPENQIFEKMKKKQTWRYYHFTNANHE